VQVYNSLKVKRGKIMKVYAVFKYPENGFNSDIQMAKDSGLVIGKRYEVWDVDIGSWHNNIYLSDVSGGFNSVQFEFEDELGKKVDIYHHTEFCHYIY
jgi:hypothetical protein